MTAAFTASAALQEAPFACFEDEDFSLGQGTGAGSSRGELPTFNVTLPPAARALPPRTVTKLRSLETVGSGTFYFQNDALRHRFLCWRVNKNVVLLREFSLHESLEGNGLRLQFPTVVVPTGVTALEAWDGQSVVVAVVTHAGSIHRFSFQIPSSTTATAARDRPSILCAGAKERTGGLSFPPPSSSSSSVFPRKPHYKLQTDVVNTLQTDEAVTTALWVNEYNVVVATDAGRMVGVNFGLPLAGEPVTQEFVFSDESVVKWLWNGLVKGGNGRRSSGSTSTANGADSSRLSGDAIVAMTFFPMNSANDGSIDTDSDADDVCLLTLAADFTLRAWSFRTQVCLGKQNIRTLVRKSAGDAHMSDIEEDGDDADVLAVQAKLMAIPSTTSGACRVLAHVDCTDEYAQQIVLLRGDDISSPRGDLDMEVARVFTVGQGKRMKFVDFAVEKEYLYSSWRSTRGDFIYSHPNPMALTGPKVIPGQLVNSIDVQMKKYEAEDRELPFQLTSEGVETLIDNFFVERLLLPGRFSRQCLYNAVSEYHGSAVDAPLRSFFMSAGHQESRYKDLLISVVSDKSLQVIGSGALGGAIVDQARAAHMRVGIWHDIIDICTKSWHAEVAPIGFASAPGSMVLGSPLLLRRNRLSVLFPSTSTITSTLLARRPSSKSTSDLIRDIGIDVLPVFDAFPSHRFQASIQNEVSSFSADWKVESLISIARQCVRLGMKPVRSERSVQLPEVVMTRALLRLSQLIGVESQTQISVLKELVNGLAPGFVALDYQSPSDDPFAKHGEVSSEEADEDENMSGDIQLNRYFSGREISFAFSQVTARTLDELCTQALRVVLCLGYLVDAKPTFMDAATLKAVERVMLPKAIVIYQRWSLSRWLAHQNCSTATELEISSAKTSGSLLPPLLQYFLQEANESLNRVPAFQQVRAIVDMKDIDPFDAEDPHHLFATFASGILELVSRPNDQLVSFLQKKKEYSILRSMLTCSLNDMSLQDGLNEHSLPVRIHSSDLSRKYMQAVAECLAWEGYQSSRQSSASMSEEAAWCYKQAIRCFNMCLSSYCSQLQASEDELSVNACERFVNGAVQLLKETVVRGFYSEMLSFLWVIATEALQVLESKTLQSFVWVNIFKYSVEEGLYQDAHLALMRTVALSSLSQQAFSGHVSNGVGDVPESEDITKSALECTDFFVKELCRRGRLDLVCDLVWGPLESEVEKHIQWLAANASVLKDGNIDPSVIMYHQLLFAFYVRRNQPANAASALYSLFALLRLSPIKSAVSLRTQRNALLGALNSLEELGEENRWIVRKDELHVVDRQMKKAAGTDLKIVTWVDMERELVLVEGKLRLLECGHEESMLMATLGATEVVALLVEAALSASFDDQRNTVRTTMEKRQESIVSLELAAHISSKHALGYASITRSLSRACVANAERLGLQHVSWELLKTYLRFVDELEQYEMAAAAILDWKVKFVLPVWITERLTCARTGNASALVLLYLKHGLLIEATQVATAMIPIEITREGEKGFRQRTSTAASAVLPWLPYNVFDAVLNAAEAALTRGRGVSHVEASDIALRTECQKLRERLAEYFRFTETLEQARRVAGMASTL
ncbi:hypothetical protein PINS_up010232 [Pythium insidiosum]|nr:hypothetical protein PINS_up010232 [Pythium insidiosum]